jgi:hypothetical protein
MRQCRLSQLWFSLCLAPVLPSAAHAADVIGNILQIDSASRSMVLRTDQRWSGLHAGALGEVWTIAVKPDARFYKVSPGEDLAHVAGSPGRAAASAFDRLAAGDRVLVRGERRERAIAADVVVDEGLSYWIMHQHVAGAFGSGEISVVGPSVYYSEGKHSFMVGCAEFIAGAHRNGAEGAALAIPGAPPGGFWDPPAAGGDPMGAIEKSIREACASAVVKQAAAAAEQARIQNEFDARFRGAILGAWRAADEAEPFASIRGESDPAGPAAWAARIQLPGAERCVLTMTTGTRSASLWTYTCQFGGGGAVYERLVKYVQSALGIAFQPDETAIGVNQVYFSDPAKPAWRLVVTSIGATSQVVLRVTPRELAATIPGGFPGAVTNGH